METNDTILFSIMFVTAILAGILAKKKERSFLLWFILQFFFIIPIMVLIFLGNPRVEKEKRIVDEKEAALERKKAARRKQMTAAENKAAREEAAEKQRQRDKEKRLKQKADETAFKERIIEKHGEEIWQSYKEGDLCYDMPIELVRLMKGKEGQKKQSASKGSGTKTQLFYGKKTSKRGTVSYTLRIDFENGLCSGWTDL